MTVRAEISLESPIGADVEALLAERNAHFAALYPGRDGLVATVQLLAEAQVRFFTVRLGERLVGCGALIVRDGYGELKRFFLREDARGLGLGMQLLRAAEEEARRLDITVIRLEVGVRQPQAFALYTGAGYVEIGPFGGYVGDPLNRYLEKQLG